MDFTVQSNLESNSANSVITRVSKDTVVDDAQFPTARALECLPAAYACDKASIRLRVISWFDT
jgi:hypothetical protein